MKSKMRLKSSWMKSTLQFLNIPGINYRMGAMIIAEIGDFNRFEFPDTI